MLHWFLFSFAFDCIKLTCDSYINKVVKYNDLGDDELGRVTNFVGMVHSFLILGISVHSTMKSSDDAYRKKVVS